MVCTAYVRWRGMSASYTTDERQIMRQLRVSEQAVVHALKAFTDGELTGRTRVVAGSDDVTGCVNNGASRVDHSASTDPTQLEKKPGLVVPFTPTPKTSSSARSPRGARGSTR
jgi:hypothetical protein